MRKVFEFSLFVYFITLSQSGYAMPPNVWEPEIKGVRHNQPQWLTEIQTKLKQQSLFDHSTDTLGGRRIFCTFELRPTGQIVGLKIISSCGSESLDDLALQTIRKAQPFALPDQKLNAPCDLVVMFSDKSNSLKSTYPLVFLSPSKSWNPDRFH
jgi:TonB family protein